MTDRSSRDERGIPRLAALVGLLTVIALAALGAGVSARAQTTDDHAGKIVTGSLPPNGGFGLLVYGGGSFEQLVLASSCPVARAVFWFTVDGGFVVFVPGTTNTAANAAAQATFPNNTIPAGTPAIGRCIRIPIVVLDPGHGGDDSGAAVNGIVERDSNLDMALRVEAILAHENCTVVLTRRTAERPIFADSPPGLTNNAATFLDLQDRVSIANAAHADVFIAIHSNAWSDPEQRGLEVWFDAQRPFAQQNRALADALARRIDAGMQHSDAAVPVAANPVREDGELIDYAGHATPLFVLGSERDVSRDEILARGIDPESVGFTAGQTSIRTRATQMPGALVELLYLTNDADARLLQDDGARGVMAQGIADGILEFLDGGSGNAS